MTADPPVPTHDPSSPPTFEQSLDQLEQIVHQLEEGQRPLTEALGLYETGIQRLKQCYELLQHAEQRIEQLAGVDADGNPVTKPFAHANSAAANSAAADSAAADSAAVKSALRADAPPAGRDTSRPTSGPSSPPRTTARNDIDEEGRLF